MTMAMTTTPRPLLATTGSWISRALAQDND